MSSLVAAAAVSIVFTTGCANNFSTTATKLSSAASTGGLGGSVHGGSQPIIGSSVQLYYAGNTGYGTGSAALGSAVITGTGGSFTYGAFTCPANNPETYLLSTGGNTNGAATGAANSNVNSVLMVALGPCNGIAAMNNINISEVTTAASVFALAQYINPGTSTPGSMTMGAPSTTQAQAGLTTAFSTVNLLTNITTGQAVSSFTNTGANTSVNSVTVTGVPEFQKLNTIADVLAYCVNTISNTNGSNTTSGQCTSLFNAAAPPPDATVTSQPTATFAKAVDTVQAAYYMAVNPTDIAASNTAGTATSIANITTLYGFVGGSSPYQSSLSTQPSDWTVGILYSSNGTTIANNGAATVGTSSYCNNTGTTNLFINDAYQDSVDGSGNIWMANGGSSSTSTLAQMSPLGVPLYCSTPLTGTSRGGSAIDSAGNVYTVAQTNIIYRYNGTTFTQITVPAPTGGVAPTFYTVAADGTGNIYASDFANGFLFQVPNAATTPGTPVSIGTIASAKGNKPTTVAVDLNGTVFTTPNTGSTLTAFPLTGTVAASSTSFQTPVSIASTANFISPYGLALGLTNRIFSDQSNTTASAAKDTFSYVTGNYTVNPPTFALSAPTSPYDAGAITPRVIAVDGAGNVWSGNASAAPYAVNELSNNLVALSPTQAANAGGFIKPTTYFSTPRGIAIDPSGNIWVTNFATATDSHLVEIVGAAVPVVTPISATLSTTTKTGTGPVKP